MIPTTVIDDDTAVRTFKALRPDHRRQAVFLPFDQFHARLLDDDLRPWLRRILLGELHIALPVLLVFHKERDAVQGSRRDPVVRRLGRFARKRIERLPLHLAVDEQILAWLDGRLKNGSKYE